jgi:hypothetical protein
MMQHPVAFSHVECHFGNAIKKPNHLLVQLFHMFSIKFGGAAFHFSTTFTQHKFLNINDGNSPSHANQLLQIVTRY